MPASEAEPTPRIVARLEPGLRATLTDLEPLGYADGGDPGAERPAHVRAASAVRAWRDRLVILQDDANVVAVRRADGTVDGLLLPWGTDHHRLFDEVRGNKAAKLDLEACVALPDGRLVAFGSGSTDQRERLVVLTPTRTSAADDPETLAVTVREAGALYAALRGELRFAGSELNLEGAVVLPDALRLFQRGNGAPRGDLQPLDATADLPLGAFLGWLDGGGPVPPLTRLRQYDLGRARGEGGRAVGYGFTDAAALPGGRVAFLAGAEDSPDATRDGEVLGCRFGILDGEEAIYTDILGEDGRPAPVKLEGIEPLDSPRGDLRFTVVADMDSPDTAALLGVLRVSRPIGARTGGDPQ